MGLPRKVWQSRSYPLFPLLSQMYGQNASFLTILETRNSPGIDSEDTLFGGQRSALLLTPGLHIVGGNP